ncbi:DNA-binding protein [Lampropedia aestuarii]|uniref:DNA-binding protein n=1 Tax=Lampropedia aestuarii TaxID=2562762 RepID=UPI0024686344|nr:DNA-binding protein [Lampropedia aestuarii]MDH5859240.1 DNA-binding protein [Lampropedia aestuarii]
MAISKESIFAAADAMLEGGQRVTLEAVRQITGGSYTTISPALNEWKAKQAAAAMPLREAAPQSVVNRLNDLGTEIWAVAMELANSRLATEREALDKARQALEANRDEATALADKLSAQLEAMQGRLTVAEEASVAAQGQVKELEEALGSERVRVQTADARVEELRRELDRAQAGLLDASKEASSAREASARMAGQIEVLKEQSEALMARLPVAGK